MPLKLRGRIVAPSAAALLAATSASTLASSLSVIPTLSGDTDNQGRAITPDGQFVVGISGTRGFLYRVGHDGATNVLSSDGAQSSQATGVGYRTSGGNTELIIAGLSSGYITEWMTADGGQSFGIKRRDATWTYNNMPGFNALGSKLGSDLYYIANWTQTNPNGKPLWINQGSGAWVATLATSSKNLPSDAQGRMNGVSASGRAVGWRRSTSDNITRNYLMQWTGPGSGTVSAVFYNGLDGTTAGQGFSVSADGNTVFGHSPRTGFPSTNNYGYKTTFSGNTQLTIDPLPLFGDEGGSTSIQIPYGCTADGKIAVGMAYRGMEKAVLWDTSDPNPANWWVLDLTTLATAEGILGGFIRLTRAYSVGIDPNTGERVITGAGIWSPDGGTTLYTRGFVMNVVPEPGPALLLGLGGLMFLFRLRRR